MSYKNKELCTVRTITTFLSLTDDKELWEQEIVKASTFCADLSAEMQENGYTVQSVRIVTNPFGEYLNTDSLALASADLTYLSQLLNSSDTSGVRVRFAIGEANTKNEIDMLPELIKEFGDLCNVCVNVALDECGILDNELIMHSAAAIKKISNITPRGEGNFNFTVNFNCEPLIPYFPASYHKSALGNRFVIGLETPDLLVNVLKDFNQDAEGKAHNALFKGYYEAMSTALQYHISQIQNIIDQSPINMTFAFSGFDSSAAPSKNCASMAEVYELMGVEYFGASGTVEASALLTKVFKSVKGVDLVGFSGLMLALTEDMGLAQGTVSSHFDIRSLLTYSSVCGIGLDTVPIPGDTSIDKISALMRDTGTMAYRLNKPLTVRVFPVPGLVAGDMTVFESEDLCNCAVLAVP
ncbi:DUF711 family protein [Shewanella sp. VB17]|uniref:DUF711 family protein n=1 Tax=Shewanella sp. VB17 TaxID=2739432 RepID=UPI00156503F7|nr:DUF711 family protein [Shewanella sp. VB17]NRD75183.1 DUF711 family protein [Shewanella sp. VB17]